MKGLRIAITSLIFLLPSPAHAQWYNRTQPPQNPWQLPWQRPQQERYPGEYWQRLPAQAPVSREQLRWVNELGGGQNEFGNLNRPVPSSRIVPGNYPNGVYRFPMDWDPNRSIIFNIQEGQIRRQDYVIPPR